VLSIPDAELLAKLRFRHTAAEESAANARAMEILEQSPYGKQAAEGGLFLQALQARVKFLPYLIQPHFGEHVVDASEAVQNHDILRGADVFDDELVGQVAALPLGSKLIVNPWTGQIEYFRSEPIPEPKLRERADFAVRPFLPFLEYVAEKEDVPKPTNALIPANAPKPASAPKPRITQRNSGTAAQLAPPVKKTEVKVSRLRKRG
jgi:hypothetical protein